MEPKDICKEMLQVLPRMAVWMVVSPVRGLDVNFSSAT